MTAHVIRDIRLRTDQVWVACSCGERIEGDDQETMNDPWQAHRVAHGERPRSFASSEYKPLDPFRWREKTTVSTTIGAEAQRAYRERNKAKLAEAQRAYRERNREAVNERQRDYLARKRDEVAA